MTYVQYLLKTSTINDGYSSVSVGVCEVVGDLRFFLITMTVDGFFLERVGDDLTISVLLLVLSGSIATIDGLLLVLIWDVVTMDDP